MRPLELLATGLILGTITVVGFQTERSIMVRVHQMQVVLAPDVLSCVQGVLGDKGLSLDQAVTAVATNTNSSLTPFLNACANKLIAGQSNDDLLGIPSWAR